MQGVARTSDEIETIKSKIVSTMSSIAGSTFYGCCQVAGVAVSEAYTWKAEDEEFRNAVAAAYVVTEEMALDLAQSKLIKKIHEDVLKAITYYLDRKGSSRGFNPKVTNEMTGPGGLPLEAPRFVIDFNGPMDQPTPPLPDDATHKA